MSLYHNSKQKLRNLKRTIDGLLDGDFPLTAGRRALQRLRAIVIELDKQLDRAHQLNDDLGERTYSHAVNVKVYQTLPVLGFILRSTNVRNAFEFLDPFQVIADATLQGSPQLLLSSEWDYVPFAYPQSLEDLRSFVLIGMPASEAASALLLPLAGHELAHAAWQNRGLGSAILPTIQQRCIGFYDNDVAKGRFKQHFPLYDPSDIIHKELLPEAIALSVKYAAFQAEELFCDMFAYALFGQSYIYAFAYILAPGTGGRAAGTRYPSHKTRISVLAKIAQKEQLPIPDVSLLKFSDERPHTHPQERYIVEMAERSVTEIVPALWDYVTRILADGQVCRPSIEMCNLHLRDFKMGVPSSEPKCLGDIINAGWEFYLDLQKPKAGQRVATEKTMEEKIDDLNEMILKTVEVLEFKRRIGTK